ncbi:MAG TPA: DM9 repeat-containing protein, partial [Polyangia bacterium]
MKKIALSYLGLVLAAAGCGAQLDPSSPEATSATSLPTTLPPGANWALRPSQYAFNLPDDAIVIGHDTDGAPLYSCRASYNGGLHPGKTRSDSFACRFSYGGTEQQATTYQVLVPAWTPAANGVIPVDAIPFGNEAGGSPLYACSANYGGGTQLGKLGVGFDGCFVPWGGQEIHVASYSVLTGTLPLVPVAAAATPLASAIVGGSDSDGATLYPCLAPFAGGVHPGKTRSGWGACDVSYGGGEHWIADYQLLVPELNTAPLGPRAWAAGHEARVLLVAGSPLGVCAAPTAALTEVGKYLASGACDYPEAAQEIVASGTFGVLSAALPSFAPHSFEYGNLALGDQRKSTITFVADFDDDITASLGSSPAMGFHIDRVTSWKSAGSAAPVVDQTVNGGGPLHVAQGERVTVDFTLDPDPWNYTQ